tara:strand:- start:348 stop:503 length:156 start_codon:yes stop_codon:yes gene_type:complete
MTAKEYTEDIFRKEDIEVFPCDAADDRARRLMYQLMEAYACHKLNTQYEES